jgi:DNA ligase-1
MPPVVERRKPIQVQLAKVYEGQPLEGLYIAEPKYDGLRGVIVFKGCKGEALTRTGLPIPNAKHVIEELAKTGNFFNTVLDGEFLADDWNLSQSIVKTQEPHPEAEKLKFYVFDIIPLECWVAKKPTQPLWFRKEELERRVGKFKFTLNVPHHCCSTPQDVLRMRDIHVQEGFEGIMLKDLDAPYAFKKSLSWLKVKPIHEGDFIVIGAVEGRGKHKGKLGALKLVGTVQWKGKDVKVESEVGTGFNDPQREELWADFKANKLIGRIVEVEYQEVTEDGALRFPAFKRVRDDK